MGKSWSSLLLVFIAAAVAGCGRGGGPLKKMTAEDARACRPFASGEGDAAQEPRGGALREDENEMEVREQVEGRGTVDRGKY